MADNERVFIDSNYFVALANPADSLHQKALGIAERLDATKVALVISNFIFLETATVLAQRRGKTIAVETGEYLIANPRVEIIHIDEALQEETWRTFQEIKNKNVSFVDCSTIVVMRAEGIRGFLTFDVKDFKPLQKEYRFLLY